MCETIHPSLTKRIEGWFQLSAAIALLHTRPSAKPDWRVICTQVSRSAATSLVDVLGHQCGRVQRMKLLRERPQTPFRSSRGNLELCFMQGARLLSDVRASVYSPLKKAWKYTKKRPWRQVPASIHHRSCNMDLPSLIRVGKK